MQRLITRSPDVTRLLDRLEQQGWVSRGWSRENRRLSVATITDEGLSVLKHVDTEVRRIEEQALGALSSEEIERISRICDRIADSFD
jgi:DNA-binding MarR family transcriptional regulator